MNEELLVLKPEESDCRAIKNHEYANYSALKVIDLPKNIEIIEDYAFYRCISLEEIYLYAGIRRLGCGAFMGCKKLKKIVVREVEEDIHFLTEILYDFQYEVEVELWYRDGRKAKLTFPEYYEEAVENTPARIIDVVFHGSGYKYRQCISSRKMDFEKYDSLFSYAVAQEFSSTCIQMAKNRLRTPVSLKEAARLRYLAYLQEQGEDLSKKVCEEEDLPFLEILAEQGYFTEELLEKFQTRAAFTGKAELVSFLMEHRRKYFPPKKKTFDFDEF